MALNADNYRGLAPLADLQTLAYVGLLCFTYKFQVALNVDNYRGLALGSSQEAHISIGFVKSLPGGPLQGVLRFGPPVIFFDFRALNSVKTRGFGPRRLPGSSRKLQEAPGGSQEASKKLVLDPARKSALMGGQKSAFGA